MVTGSQPWGVGGEQFSLDLFTVHQPREPCSPAASPRSRAALCSSRLRGRRPCESSAVGTAGGQGNSAPAAAWRGFSILLSDSKTQALALALSGGHLCLRLSTFQAPSPPPPPSISPPNILMDLALLQWASTSCLFRKSPSSWSAAFWPRSSVEQSITKGLSQSARNTHFLFLKKSRKCARPLFLLRP